MVMVPGVHGHLGLRVQVVVQVVMNTLERGCVTIHHLQVADRIVLIQTETERRLNWVSKSMSRMQLCDVNMVLVGEICSGLFTLTMLLLIAIH